MYLKELVVESYGQNARKEEFNFSVNCVSDLYWLCLPKKVDTSPFKKIIITAVESEADASKPYDDMVDVVRIRVRFDFAMYWRASKHERKRMALELIYSGISVLTKKFGWDYAVFKKAYEAVLMKDFIHRGLWRKPIVSPNKKLKAQYFFDFDSDEIKVEAVIMRRSGEEIRREFVTSVKPHWFFIDDTLEPIKWNDNHLITISTKDRRQTWIVKSGC